MFAILTIEVLMQTAHHLCLSALVFALVLILHLSLSINLINTQHLPLCSFPQRFGFMLSSLAQTKLIHKS